MIVDEKRLEVPATLEHLDDVMGTVQIMLEDKDVNPSDQMKLELCVEELYTNIANYAYESEGVANIKCVLSDNPTEILIRFVDSGIPFNPLQREDPDINADVDARPIGGLGIFLTKQFMDEVKYEYSEGKNILTIKKIFIG